MTASGIANRYECTRMKSREENDAQNPSWQTYKSIQASGEGKGSGLTAPSWKDILLEPESLDCG